MFAPSLLSLLRGRVIMLAGAGVSAANGIRTFCGDEGLYRGLDTEINLPAEVALPEIVSML